MPDGEVAVGGVVRGVVLVAATVASGMIAGLFYAYACSVMPALRGVDDRTFIEVMQRINRAIRNGWFAVSFAGSVILTAAAVALHLGDGHGAVLVPAGVALVLHITALLVTVGRNIALNDGLEAAGQAGDPVTVRAAFEVPWTRWNVVRTVLTLGAFVALCVALTGYGRTVS